ncbi:MAG TPA: helix-turn-helix transcriptional regulator [Acidobacteriota bacterium]
MKFSQSRVARLLGHKNEEMLSRYEHGRSLPPLLTALKLEIIYRVPVAFLYPELYETLRNRIRAEEGKLSVRGLQQALPLN